MEDKNRKAGFIYGEDGNSFCSVWAPLAKGMKLHLLSPRKEIIELHKNEWGYWQANIPHATPGMRYLFQSDQNKPLPDPASFSQPEGVHGPSELVDLYDYPWQDAGWKGVLLRDMIIYEIHTGTFSPEGNFDGIIKHLDYLNDLGINTLEIMPVAQFPGERNWGYDGVYPFAVQNSYGGVNGLKSLVDKAHSKGMAVILDVVYNHLGPEGNYLGEFGPYNTEKYHTPWAKAMNFDDAYCDGVREYYWQNALMWLEDFHIDGLRIDAVHAIWDNSANHFVELLTEKVRELEKRTGRKKVLIAEFDLNNPRYINSLQNGGYGLDGQWIDEFHHALHSLVTGEKDGYYEDFGSIKDLEKSFRDSYVFTGQYSHHRKKIFGRPTTNPYHQFVVFAQNHDHTGNRMKGERLVTILESLYRESTLENQLLKFFELTKLIAATYLLSPYIPLIFMGEEYGERNPFLFFTDHSDKDLIANTSKGRKKEFASFGWKENPPEPNDLKTFLQSKLSWNTTDQKNSVLLRYYQSLIHLRKTHPAMQSTEREDMTVYPSTENILAYKRKSSGSALMVVLNFGEVAENYVHPDINGRIIFNSSDRVWNGHEQPNINNELKDELKINPLSAVVIELNP